MGFTIGMGHGRALFFPDYTHQYAISDHIGVSTVMPVVGTIKGAKLLTTSSRKDNIAN